MKVLSIVVGKVGRMLASATLDYERRAARYWNFEVIAVKAERAGGPMGEATVREREAQRLLTRVPTGAHVVALTRVGGDAFSSERFARYLNAQALRAAPAVAFVTGGAFGLGNAVLERAHQRMRLSAFTLPHDFVRLLLAEQLYRAGTILKGEPYHKGER